jgi:hypothetical protein
VDLQVWLTKDRVICCDIQRQLFKQEEDPNLLLKDVHCPSLVGDNINFMDILWTQNKLSLIFLVSL